MYFRRLKDIREDRELTQTQVASFLNMKQQQYARYEAGINEIPFSYIIKLAKFYDVSIDYLAGLTNETKAYEKIS